MPLPTSPNQKCPVVLESDQDKTKAEQPTFIFRFLTGLEQMDLAEAMDALPDEPSGLAAMKKVFATAATGLVGWRNIKGKDGKQIPFDAEKLSSVIGMNEAHELIRKQLDQSLPVDGKKKLESPSGSNTEQSKAAKDAQESPNVKTSQTT